jgi:hypothetical protein
MTHDELIEEGAKWLQSKGCSVVITDMTHGHTETPDCIGWRCNNVSVLLEVKVSRSDFLADKRKIFRHPLASNTALGNLRYYLTPEGLVDPSEIPDKWGLIELREPRGRQKNRRIVLVKGHAPTTAIVHSSDSSMYQETNKVSEVSLLISAIRRVGQTCPEGVSVKAYTFQTKNRATLGVLEDEAS